MNKISLKKHYVATSGWRGYHEFINTVAGANDTGTFSDSPCPSSVRKREIRMATSVLRKAGIPYRTGWCQSTNCFMNQQQIAVAPENRARAIELLKPLESETQLLWVNRS